MATTLEKETRGPQGRRNRSSGTETKPEPYPFAQRVPIHSLSGKKSHRQNRNEHGGRKRTRNHSAVEIAGFFASPAERNR